MASFTSSLSSFRAVTKCAHKYSTTLTGASACTTVPYRNCVLPTRYSLLPSTDTRAGAKFTSQRLFGHYKMKRKTPPTVRHLPASVSSGASGGGDNAASDKKSAPKPKKAMDGNGRPSAESSNVSMYRFEGLLAVRKPLTWTSNDVVSYIRGILSRDARGRGCTSVACGENKRGRGKKRRKEQMLKVGHGGTLDPLATGVLVVGVGKGTKLLQQYLAGGKTYVATAELGYETTTLDSEGDVTKSESWEHVTMGGIESMLPKFRGKIQQIPPLYSALKVNGKKLYDLARKEGKTEKDVEIKAREVEILSLEVVQELDDPLADSLFSKPNGVAEGSDRSGKSETKVGGSESSEKNAIEAGEAGALTSVTIIETSNDKRNLEKQLKLPHFGIEVKCGGGTYIRSLVRDMGRELNTAATMTGLVRTQQGPFGLEEGLKQEEWSADVIYETIEKNNRRLEIL